MVMCQHRTSEQFTTGFSGSEDCIMRKLCTEHALQVLHMSLSVFMYSERDLQFLPLLFRLFRYEDGSGSFFNGSSFLHAVMKTVTERSASSKELSWCGIAVPTPFEALNLLHSFPVVHHFIKEMDVKAHMLPGTGNMNGFADLANAQGFHSVCKSGGVGSVP